MALDIFERNENYINNTYMIQKKLQYARIAVTNAEECVVAALMNAVMLDSNFCDIRWT